MSNKLMRTYCNLQRSDKCHVICTPETANKLADAVMRAYGDKSYMYLRGGIDEENKVVKILLGTPLREVEGMTEDAFIVVHDGYPKRFMYLP